MKLGTQYIFALIILAGCAQQSWIKTRRVKKIRLSEFLDERRLGYQTDKAIIYFRINDITALLQDQLEEQGHCPECKDYVERLKVVKKDTIISQNKDSLSSFSLGGYIETYFTKDLLISGNAMVYDRRNQNYPTKIKYEFLEDRLGGEQGNFYYLDGEKFYSVILALGE